MMSSEMGWPGMPGEVDMSRAVWRKSTRSGSDGGNCVEIASLEHHIAIRDSKATDAPPLIFPKGAFDDFLAAVKDGEFDR